MSAKTAVRVLRRLTRDLRNAEGQIADDMRAFHAPSECAGLAYAGHERYAKRLLEEVMSRLGVTREEIEAEYDRCTAEEQGFLGPILMKRWMTSDEPYCDERVPASYDHEDFHMYLRDEGSS